MQKRDLWLFFSICIICLLVMLPRILSAQFGLLDDGVLLSHAQQSLSNISSVLYEFQGAGRFLPTALLLRTFVFSFAGFEPQRWYIWSTCILIIICIEMAFIARQYSFNRIQALLSVLFFVVSPTLIENFYTLSKSEIPLLLLIASAILLTTTIISSSNRLLKVFVVIVCFLMLSLSFGAKETAIVLPFLFVSWLLISWVFFRRTGKYQDFIQTDLILLAGSLIGCVLYWMFRSMLGMGGLSSYSGGYQLFNIEKLLFNSKALLGWLTRDYPYLLPILAVLFIKPLRHAKITFFTLRWFTWMGAWALVLLPWNYLSYYLLPFSFGSALFCGMILGQTVSFLRLKDSPYAEIDSAKDQSLTGTANKNWLAILYATSSILILPPAFNATAYATEQLVFDRANWQFIEQVVKLPPNSLLLVNLPYQDEYFYEMRLFVGQILSRPDISIEAYSAPTLLDEHQKAFLASPTFINQILPRVRGLNGASVVEWRRCLESTANSYNKVFSSRLERPLLDIGLHRLLIFLNGSDMIGNSNRKIIARTSIVYGWDMWKIPHSLAEPARAGVYRDGIFTLQTQSGDFRSVSFGKGDVTPLTGDINHDGFTDLVIYNKRVSTWMVDYNLDGKVDQSFTLPDMQPDDIPLIGDWNGDGEQTPGFFRASDASWHLYNSFIGQVSKTYHFGEASDIPITGDWNGDGIDDMGVYRPKTGYTLLAIDPNDSDINPFFDGPPSAIPVAASWDGTRRDTLAFVNGNTWTIYPYNNNCYPANPLKTFQLKYSGIPLAVYGWTKEK